MRLVATDLWGSAVPTITRPRRLLGHRRTALLLGALGAALLTSTLSGCTARVLVSDAGPAAAPEPTLTAAGEYYLDTICPRNGATYAFDAVRASDDLSVLHRAATAGAIASQRAAAGLRAIDAPWPKTLQPDIALLAVSLDQDVVTYEGIANATSVADARRVPDPGNTSAGDAKLRIRQAIGLTTAIDAVDDCVGHYGGAATPAPPSS